MRDMTRRFLPSLVILSMVIITITWVPPIPVSAPESSNLSPQDKSSPAPVKQDEAIPIEETKPESKNAHNLADTNLADGILNPVTVEQSGYAASGNISARTDNYQNLAYDLPLDVTHGWIADVAEVSVWNLEKLFVANGTYDQGFPGVNVNPNGTIDYYPLGWSANSTDTAAYPDDVQLAAYDNTGRQYVMVENQGGKVGQNSFGHAAGTTIIWTQSIQNAPYTEDFLLDFNYFYLRGPLDKNPGAAISGNCTITVLINGITVWNMSLLTLSQRGVWTDTGVIPITVTGAPSSFVFQIGLVIDQSLVLDKRLDYDNNGIADGIGNAAYITVYLDDVSFIKAIPPAADQVQLEFSTGGISEALAGSMGTYYASITNSSYWTTTPVLVAMTSNTSISFEYKTRLHSHRFTDSNWRTNIDDVGVAYTVDHGISSDITLYTYVGYLGNYEDPEMMLFFPDDWENVTVSDPFLTDLTGTCTIWTDNLTVPTSIIDRLGWWQVKMESPNYAKSIKSQILNVVWVDETTFRIGNTTRADISIGTVTETPVTLTDVNITWFNPYNQLWYSELRPGTSGQVTSTGRTFNSGSSPAGEWWVEVFWTNGTEVAYDRANFEIYHSTSLVADPIEIFTNAGSKIKGLIRYIDGDTGTYLMNPVATLNGNWSGSTIPFVPNSIQNWWEADFDTSITGAGIFTIVVTASQLFYDDASCTITVYSTNTTRLSSPSAPWTAVEWGGVVSLTFKYEVYYSPTGTWLHVNNNTDVAFSVNWTAGYWSIAENRTLGVYFLELNSSVAAAGTFLLNVSFSKPYHETKTLLLTLILSPMASSLTVFEGLSDRVDLEQSKQIKLGYSDRNGNPVQGANVVVESISPSSGLSHTSIVEVSGEEGNYTVTLTPYTPTVFTVRFVATGSNAQPASSVYVLVVNDVSTSLTIFGGPSIEIGLTESYNTTFRFELYNGTGVENAEISIVYSGPSGNLNWNISEFGLGNYSIQFRANLPSTYVVTIIAFKPFHQRASSSFSLIVRNIPTTLVLSVGASDAMGLTDTYEMSFAYKMDNETGIDSAAIDVFHSGESSAITPQVTPMGFGNYTVQFTATLSGSYLVTIAASKQYFQGDSKSFLLTVRAINTTMTPLNGTSDFVGFGKSYRLFVSYTNGSGYGLDNATVSVVKADAGINFDPAESEGLGRYSILLTPLSSDTFSITVQATLKNHETRTVFFTLVVTAIPTTLTTLNASTSISVDQTYTVSLYFQDEDSNALVNATLGVLNQPAEIGFSVFEELGNGIYRVTLTPSTLGTFDIVFSASKAGYQTDYTRYQLTATTIHAELKVSGDAAAASISYSQQYGILVFYRRIDTGQNISGATIRVSTLTSGLTWSSHEETGGGYRITLTPQRAANWTISLIANKSNCEEGSTQFRLTVNPIVISVSFVTELEALEGRPFNITVSLAESGSNIPIDGAIVTYRFHPSTATGSGLFHKMDVTGNPGEYTVSLSVPLFADSVYIIEISVEKENYKLPEVLSLPFVIHPDVVAENSMLLTATGGFGGSLVAVFVALRIVSARKKKQLNYDLVNKRRFDDADNLIGAIVLHKKSGIPIYSRIPKGGFDEGIVAAFVSAVTHFREEFEMFDEEMMQVIPISDIIRAVQTRNLICAFVTVRSASMDHNRKMEAYAMQVGTYLDDLFEEQPSSLIDSKITEMLDFIFDTTMDGNLIKYYKMSTSEPFPKRYRLLERLMKDIEMKHCSKPVYLAQGVATYGVTQARGCTLVLEAIDLGLISICEEHEVDHSGIDFKQFFRGSEERANSKA
jgi:hypothetical protein